MSQLKVSYLKGATPIDPNEMKDLIPDYISEIRELNQLEQANIADAFIWVDQQPLDDLLTPSFVFLLHKRMFSEVWKWAGKMRLSNKNIGVPKEQIPHHLGQLLKNTEHQVRNVSYPIEELASRFHHRLVAIHVFPNGNGRHARLMTDLLLKKCGFPKFTWGIGSAHTPIDVEGKTRSQYIEVLKAADQGNFKPLIKFVKS